MKKKWQDFKTLGAYVKKFFGVVSQLHDQAQSLISFYDTISLNLKGLEDCSYNFDEFKSHLQNIQDVIDKLNLADYSNLDKWVFQLDKNIEKILLKRILAALEGWNGIFTKDQPKYEKKDENLIISKRRKMFAIKK